MKLQRQYSVVMEDNVADLNPTSTASQSSSSVEQVSWKDVRSSSLTYLERKIEGCTKDGLIVYK